MRIAAYNILAGGTGRLDPLAETLRYINADITALIEADCPDAVAYLAHKTGCQHAQAESPTSNFHVALLSRFPIRSAINLGIAHPTLSRAAMLARLDTPLGPVNTLIIHLHAGLGRDAEARRIDELNPILHAHTDPDTPTIIAGDLNTNAPYHPVDTHAAAPDVRQRLLDDPSLIQHTLVQSITDAGWTDAHLHADKNHPQHTFSTAHPSTRLDYIFLARPLAQRLQSAHVVTDGFTPTCSDHFPIVADLDPNPDR